MVKPEVLYHNLADLAVVQGAGYELFPCRPETKVPRDPGFMLTDYSPFDFPAWLKKGGNYGVRPRPCDLFVDVDPKNGGLESWKWLLWDLDLDAAVMGKYPIVHTGRGNGGLHYYMRLPEDGSRWRWHLKGYPGLDFQTMGHYVIGPGSVHPETGLPYHLEGPRIAFESECRQLAPEALIGALRKPPRKPSTGFGKHLSPGEVADMLACLDAADFGKGGKHHDEWLDIGMACHEASAGEAFDEWLDWCATDDQYGDEARSYNLARWDSFDSSRSDGVTYKTLLQAVVRSGNGKAVALLSKESSDKARYAAEEFSGEDL